MNHICGKCKGEFENDDLYVRHICRETGYAPVQPEHFGPEFEAISEAAMRRGEARKKTE